MVFELNPAAIAVSLLQIRPVLRQDVGVQIDDLEGVIHENGSCSSARGFRKDLPASRTGQAWGHGVRMICRCFVPDRPRIVPWHP